MNGNEKKVANAEINRLYDEIRQLNNKLAEIRITTKVLLDLAEVAGIPGIPYSQLATRILRYVDKPINRPTHG